MTDFRRRLRAAITSTIVLAWAVGSVVLPLVHPCPVRDGMSAVEASAAAPMAHAGHGAPVRSDTPGHDHDASGQCTCIGSCHAPTIATVPPSVVVAVVVDAIPASRDWREDGIRTPRAHALDLLPPSTAPPIS